MSRQVTVETETVEQAEMVAQVLCEARYDAQMEGTQVTVKAAGASGQERILAVLQDAEEEGDLDFAFTTRTDP